LISPARNEADYIRKTLDSVLAQTVLPKRWIIIDDGSTDDTPKILAEYAAKNSLIEMHTRADRGSRIERLIVRHVGERAQVRLELVDPFKRGRHELGRGQLA